MRIDAINFGAYSGITQLQNNKTDDVDIAIADEFEGTHSAEMPLMAPDIKPVSNPVEKQNGSIEDLMNMQTSTEKLVHSFGYPNIEQAQKNIDNYSNSDTLPSGRMELNA